MEDKNKPIVECQMMIRRAISEVFDAFINPSITTKFWFTKASGKLEEGKTVTWEWKMYNVSADIQVLEVIPEQLIKIQWEDPATYVDFIFSPMNEEQTYVIIKHYGFHQEGDHLIAAIKNNTAGFTTVLDGLKAYLEHGIVLNLVRDKFPQIAQK